MESFAYLYLAVSYESDSVPVLKISPPQITLQSWEGLSGKMCLRLLPLLFSAAAIACATQANAQPYTLGDRGAEVLEVQELLLVRGFNPGEADGDFGSLTEQAVVNFQQVAGLVPDGVVGVQTLAALRGTPVAVVPRQVQFVLPRSPGGLQARTGEIVLRRGDIGDGVKDLQRRLQELGYYNGSINGIFDAAVEEAVIAFQQENRLQMDGEVGFETERALFRPAEAAAASAGPPPPTFDRALQRGDEGRDVEALQQRLQELGYYGGRADGEFGSKTESALVKFQQDRGLPASGVADAATLNSLGLTSFPTTQPLVPPPGVPRQSFQTVPGGLLREGDEGAEVAALQDSLRRLGYFNGIITEYFGASTRAAVERFQRDYLLEVDGVFGFNTRNTLERVLAGQSTPVASATVPGAIAHNPITYAPVKSITNFTTSASPTFAASPVLREGDRGTDVAYLQELLEVLGYFRGERTGYFGALTKAAVENLQQDNFLPVDAVVGSQTWSVLRSTLVAR